MLEDYRKGVFCQVISIANHKVYSPPGILEKKYKKLKKIWIALRLATTEHYLGQISIKTELLYFLIRLQFMLTLPVDTGKPHDYTAQTV